MKNLPRCSEAELKVLETLTASRRASFWTGTGSVESRLPRWQRIAETAGDSRGGIDDFAYALTNRDALELVQEKRPQPSVDVLRRLMEEAYEKFRAATRDDGGRALARLWMPAGTTWWYSRRPFTGPFGTCLDAGRYGPLRRAPHGAWKQD
ncbi:hypothetical protein [Corallococcus sp. 4LFB]|uniref:hypothetical protein n=1 Tax=Corallococcus sp. 4LFB TaxID=3383249 RepID=UPI0039752595